MKKKTRNRKTKNRVIQTRVNEIALARCLDYFINHVGWQPENQSALIRKVVDAFAKAIDAQESILYEKAIFPNQESARIFINSKMGLGERKVEDSVIILPDQGQDMNPIKLLKEQEKKDA